MTRTMSEIERLVAIEEIKQLVARRIRLMDTKNWDEYPDTHAPDAVAVMALSSGQSAMASEPSSMDSVSR